MPACRQQHIHAIIIYPLTTQSGIIYAPTTGLWERNSAEQIRLPPPSRKVLLTMSKHPAASMKDMSIWAGLSVPRKCLQSLCRHTYTMGALMILIMMASISHMRCSRLLSFPHGMIGDGRLSETPWDPWLCARSRRVCEGWMSCLSWIYTEVQSYWSRSYV